MLPWFRHCRNASQLHPAWREWRLLYFASGTGNPNTGDDDDNKPENKPPETDDDGNPLDKERDDNKRAIDHILDDEPEKADKKLPDGISGPEQLDPLDIIAEKAAEMNTEINTLDSIRKRDSEIRELMEPDVWKEYVQYMNRIKIDLQSWRAMLTEVSGWKDGSVAPEDMRLALKRWLQPDDNETLVFDDFDQYIKVNNLTKEVWATLTPEERMIRIERLLSSLKGWNEQMDLIATEIEVYKNTIGAIQKEDQKRSEQEVKPEQRHLLPFEIRYITVQQMIEAVKSYGEAYGKSWNEWNKLRSSRMAQGIGKVMKKFTPLGEQVETILNRELEGNNEEVKDAYMKFLESRNIRFEQIKDLMKQNKDDGNRFRAVLEYAASRGWLYEFDVGTGVVYGYELKAGSTLPPTWTKENVKEYRRTLANKNGEGQGKMVQLGKDTVSTTDNIPSIMKILESELDDMNLWNAQGIIEVAINKGKEGEVSTWCAVTVLRFLRQNPKARDYFPIDLLDQIGNIGIQHPAWTTTLLKIDRSNISTWQKSKHPEEEFGETAGTLAKAISRIEADLIAFNPALGLDTDDARAELDRLVARVLAAQTVEVENGANKTKNFSIFSDKYKFYRDKIAQTATTIDISKADDDFFGEQSEVLLQGQEGFDAMLANSTTGEFVNPTKSTSFVEQLIGRAEDLSKNGTPEQLKAYQDEVRKKMDNFFARKMTHGPTAGVWRVKTRRNRTERVVDAFLKYGLLSPESLNAFDGKDPADKQQSIIKQLDTAKELLLDEEKMRIVRPEIAERLKRAVELAFAASRQNPPVWKIIDAAEKPLMKAIEAFNKDLGDHKQVCDEIKKFLAESKETLERAHPLLEANDPVKWTEEKAAYDNLKTLVETSKNTEELKAAFEEERDRIRHLATLVADNKEANQVALRIATEMLFRIQREIEMGRIEEKAYWDDIKKKARADFLAEIEQYQRKQLEAGKAALTTDDINQRWLELSGKIGVLERVLVKRYAAVKLVELLRNRMIVAAQHAITLPNLETDLVTIDDDIQSTFVIQDIEKIVRVLTADLAKVNGTPGMPAK